MKVATRNLDVTLAVSLACACCCWTPTAAQLANASTPPLQAVAVGVSILPTNSSAAGASATAFFAAPPPQPSVGTRQQQPSNSSPSLGGLSSYASRARLDANTSGPPTATTAQQRAEQRTEASRNATGADSVKSTRGSTANGSNAGGNDGAMRVRVSVSSWLPTEGTTANATRSAAPGYPSGSIAAKNTGLVDKGQLVSSPYGTAFAPTTRSAWLAYSQAALNTSTRWSLPPLDSQPKDKNGSEQAHYEPSVSAGNSAAASPKANRSDGWTAPTAGAEQSTADGRGAAFVSSIIPPATYSGVQFSVTCRVAGGSVASVSVVSSSGITVLQCRPRSGAADALTAYGGFEQYLEFNQSLPSCLAAARVATGGSTDVTFYFPTAAVTLPDGYYRCAASYSNGSSTLNATDGSYWPFVVYVPPRSLSFTRQPLTFNEGSTAVINCTSYAKPPAELSISTNCSGCVFNFRRKVPDNITAFTPIGYSYMAATFNATMGWSGTKVTCTVTNQKIPASSVTATVTVQPKIATTATAAAAAAALAQTTSVATQTSTMHWTVSVASIYASLALASQTLPNAC